MSSLALSGCGSDSSGLDAVKVSSGKSPSVTVKKGFTTTSTESRVVAEGSGEKLEKGDVVKLNYVAVNGRTGKQFDNSFKASPISFTLQDTPKLAGFVKGLTGQKIGSRVLVAIPPKDGFDADQPSLGIKKDDTMVFLFDVIGKVPTEASGTAKKLPASVPQLVLKDGKPAGFKKSSSTAKKMPSKPTAHVVIEGKGAAVTAQQTLSLQYVGQVYPDGTIFDSSWERGQPAQLTLAQVIPCWQQLIAGQKIGSRVILECPASSAYKNTGSQDGKVKPGDDLLFAVDILDAS